VIATSAAVTVLVMSLYCYSQIRADRLILSRWKSRHDYFRLPDKKILIIKRYRKIIDQPSGVEKVALDIIRRPQ
jgi:hypothetical protein